jgi:hypothetical protein
MSEVIEDAIRMGTEAEFILTSDAYRVVMAELDKGLIDLWSSGQFKTVEEREDVFNRVRGARMFRDRMNALIDNMRMNKAKAERAQKSQKGNGQAELSI